MKTKKQTPAIMQTLMMFNGFHLATVQTVIVVETSSASSVSKATGLQLSVETITGGVMIKQGGQGKS